MKSRPEVTNETQASEATRAERPSAPSPEAIEAALRQVIDPELGIDVVALGLIMDISIEGRHVIVEMTLTTPGCPMHETITREAEMRVERVAGVRTAEVRLVWDPPWTPERITPAGRRQLGW